MFLRQVRLKNIKGFQDITLAFPISQEEGSWCVLLGENGVGKSTILQAIALAIAGPLAAQRLLINPATWVRKGSAFGECSAEFRMRVGDERGTRDIERLTVQYAVTRGPQTIDPYGIIEGSAVTFAQAKRRTELRQRLYSSEQPGFLFAAYGAFRRLGSLERDSSHSFSSHERPLLTMFYQDAAIADAEQWLQHLDYKARFDAQDLGQQDPDEVLRTAIGNVIDRLLPTDIDIRFDTVTPDGVIFRNANGDKLTIRDLSDGYRSMFALAVDMLMWCTRLHADGVRLFRQDERGDWYVDTSGVVLIDEIDAHLHPKWQQQIGHYLRSAFPRVQFIVTTHSPFIAQAAVEKGLFVLRAEDGEVGLDESLDTVHGLDVEQVLTSPAFDMTSMVSPDIEVAIARHAELEAKANSGNINEKELSELEVLEERLSRVLPAPGESYSQFIEVLKHIKDAEGDR